MSNPNVTWLLPVKNGMPYLAEALASIEAQSYRDFRVMAWDNGSEDQSVEELRRWIPSRIPGTVVTGESLPLGECLARMVERCETEFCARFDADDINLPDRLGHQVAYLLRHQDVGILGGQYHRIDEVGRPLPVGFLPLEHEEIVSYLAITNPISHPSVMFRRSVVLRAGNYRKVGPSDVNIEDYDLWFRVALISKLENLSIPLIYQRTHERSTTVMASRKNLIRPAMADCYYQYARQLYGNTAAEARLLQNRSHPCIYLSLLRMAWFRARRSGEGTLSTLFSKAFLTIGHDLVPRWDLGSRFLLAVLLGRGAGALAEGRELIKDVLTLCGLSQYARRARNWLWARHRPPGFTDDSGKG
jgi:glycosyltransferase involved in cell wall biosynthesis